MDVLILAIFGIAGYLMRKFQFEPGPLMLTFVIGPIFEKSLRQAILIGSANPQIFISRPIAIIFFAIAMYLYLSPLIRYFIRKHKVKAAI
jgi:putative tricarboxylic transport membrane protein